MMSCYVWLMKISNKSHIAGFYYLSRSISFMLHFVCYRCQVYVCVIAVDAMCRVCVCMCVSVCAVHLCAVGVCVCVCVIWPFLCCRCQVCVGNLLAVDAKYVIMCVCVWVFLCVYVGHLFAVDALCVCVCVCHLCGVCYLCAMHVMCWQFVSCRWHICLCSSMWQRLRAVLFSARSLFFPKKKKPDKWSII